jgi:hypothetical protein
VKYKSLGFKNRRTTRVYAEIPIPRPARKDTKKESNQRRTRDRSARLGAFVERLCGHGVDKQQAAVTGLVDKRMGGFVHENDLLLDVEDCIVVRERTGGLSTTKLVTALDTISKILGKRIYPTQLMKKISKVEWGLLPVEHRLVEAQVGESKLACCVFYWAPNLPLVQEMLIASAIIEGKCEDSLAFSNYANAHIFGRGIDRGGDDLIDMTRYINGEKGNTGEWCIPVAVLEDGAEKYDNPEKTVLSKERNKVFAKQQEGKYHFFDITLVNAKESVEDARCVMIEFTADSVPGFEPRRLEVSTSMLPDHVVHRNPEVLEDDFCDVAKYARAEDREDADRTLLDHTMLKPNADGRCGLDLKMRMIKFEDDSTSDLEEGFVGCIIFCGEVKLYTFRFSAAMSVEGTIETHCKRSILINSDDGKMTTMLCGLGAAGASYPCPRCTWQLKQNLLPMF